MTTEAKLKRIVALGTSCCAVIAIAGLLGYISPLHILGSIRADYLPMAPATAIIFLTLCSVLFAHSRKPSEGIGLITAEVLTALGTVYCFLELPDFMTGINLNFSDRLFPPSGALGTIPIGKMSPATAVTFVIAGIGLLLLLRDRRNRNSRSRGNIAAGMGLSTLLIGATVVLSYLYGAPLMYGGSAVPMAATTALAFMLLGIAILASSKTDNFFTRRVAGDTTSAKLTRLFIPLVATAILLESLLTHYISASSLLNEAIVMSIMFTVTAIITTVVIERAAIFIGGNIDEATRIQHQLMCELKESEDHHRSVLQTAMDGVWLTDINGHLLEVNDAYCKMSGYRIEELLAMNATDIDATENPVDTAAHFRKVIEMGQDRFETRHRRKDGSLFDVEISAQYHPLRGGQLVAFIHDITDRTFLENANLQAGHLLLLASTYSDLHECMALITASLQSWSGCEAVGIRLQDGDEFPYYETRGFPATFIRAENQLCVYGPDGKILRDGEGKPILECMCGNILCGRYDATKPFFTERGSFWTNGTTDLLSGTTEADRQAHTRNRCNREGFESVALIPMHTGDKIIGLIQFNDHRKNCFTPSFIEIVEGIADKMALSLSRRQVEKKLHKSEKRLNEAERIGNSGSWDYDVSSDKADWSENMFRIFDVDPSMPSEQVFKHFVENLVHPDDVGHLLSVFREAISGKSPYNIEYRVLKKDGSFRNIHAVAESIYDEQGKVIRLIGRVEDITDRLRNEEALKLTRFSIEHSADALFWMTPDARIVDVNEAACRSLGYSRDELLKLTIPDIDPFYNGEVWRQHFNDLRQQGSVKLETVHTNKDGEQFPVEIVANYLQFGTEELNCAITRNIADRKLAESYREMGREILQLLYETGELKDLMPHLITLLKSKTGFDAVGIRLQDGDDFPYYSERGFPGDLLMRENSLIARTADGSICRDEHGNACLECACGLVITGKVESGQPFFTPGGSFWTNDSAPLLDLPPDADPRLHPRNECFHHDFASIALIPIRTKERTIGLIQFNDHRKNRFTRDSIEILEGIAAHIASALMRKKIENEKTEVESQLHQAQKMESIGTLAGGVAHDFNNKLSVILGYAHLALTEPVTDQVHTCLEEIRKAGEQSADLTRQLLAFARKQTIAPKVINLNETISGMLKMLQRLIGENIHLTWQPAPDIWLLKLDPSQIDQILANLCVNARDAMKDGGKITIETGICSIDEDYCTHHVDAAPGDYVRLSVSDDGCGMDNETRSRIFEPFFTTKETGKGTGLGLATVFGIVKQNGGFINVYSEPGIGTTFTINFSRHTGTTGIVSKEGMASAPLGCETILLVEDELAILNMASTILNRQGYTILSANTPAEAIRVANEHAKAIDLLITDVIMPEMNGKELAHKLQSLNPQLKCLYMSGYTAEAISRHGVLDDGVNFIQKPFSLPHLATKVRDLLDNISGSDL